MAAARILSPKTSATSLFALSALLHDPAATYNGEAKFQQTLQNPATLLNVTPGSCPTYSWPNQNRQQHPERNNKFPTRISRNSAAAFSITPARALSTLGMAIPSAIVIAVMCT